MAKGKVGIVGLGIMGGAFASNLVDAGWRVIGYDVDPARRRALARAGVEIAKDARALAAEVTTIITSLPKPAALDATVQAIIAAGGRPRVVVEASTFAIDDKLRAERALRRAGHAMGASPTRIKRVAFGISIATTAVAGALLIIIQPVEPSVGREYIGRVFAICVLGGLGSLPGTVIGAMAVSKKPLVKAVFGAGPDGIMAK